MARPKPSGIITLTTDFGLADHYVGVMKGVILANFRSAILVDLTHGVEPQQIEQGAFFLAQSCRWFPAGTVHLAVVDPGVGTERRCLAARAGEHYFVAPDNGLLSHVCVGEDVEAIDVDLSRVLPPPASQTFHARDIFAPLAARIAGGEDPASWGERVTDYLRLPPLEPELRSSGRWRGRVLNVDRFGNLVTNLTPALIASLDSGFVVRVGDAEVARLAACYEEVEDDEPFLIWGSAGYLEVSVRNGSAAEAADAWLGDEVELEGDPLS